MTTRETLERWVDGYRTAWTSNEPADIEALFTNDASYRFRPFDDPVVGHEAIVAGWLDALDENGTWTFDWRAVAIEGNTAVLEGRTEYPAGSDYRNLWVIEFADDGRATAFTEWFMEEPTP